MASARSDALATCLFFLALSVPAVGVAVEFRVSDQHGEALANAVITVDTGESYGAPVKTAEFTVIEQRRQQFNPRVTVIRPGSAVRFPNRDTTQHHVYSFSRPKAFEIELYGGDEPAAVLFSEPGIVALGCNIHDWMLGYVYISPDDRFAVSSEAGTAEVPVDVASIKSVTVWHPGVDNSVPLTFAANRLSPSADGQIALTVRLPAGDPLEHETDPLQSLFQD